MDDVHRGPYWSMEVHRSPTYFFTQQSKMDYGGLIIVCQGSCIKYASNPTGSIVRRLFDTNIDNTLNSCLLS